MSSHFDSLETRAGEAREAAMLAALPGLVASAVRAAPGWAAHLDGVDPAEVTSREALARLPVMRRERLAELQAERPPFGGLAAKAPGGYSRLFVSSGPIFSAEGRGDAAKAIARALFAAGLRPGDTVHNAFAYGLAPLGHLFDSGAGALGCAVVPAGADDVDAHVEAISQFQPKGFLGPADVLEAVLHHADETGLRLPGLRAAVGCAATLPERTGAEAGGIEIFATYAPEPAGLVAYETPAHEGLVVGEETIVELVTPGSGEPVAAGEAGEVVVTRLSPDMPLIRFATGDLARTLPGISPCGRTNIRLIRAKSG